MSNQTAEAIISALKPIPQALGSGKNDSVWTTAIKRALVDLGSQNNYKICTSGFAEECSGEWLFDLVWYRENPPHRLSEIGLVVESEWSKSSDHIRYDFEKLLVAKSAIRLMVFQDDGQNTELLWTMFREGLQSFKRASSDEFYLFACFRNNGSHGFEFRHFPSCGVTGATAL